MRHASGRGREPKEAADGWARVRRVTPSFVHPLTTSASSSGGTGDPAAAGEAAAFPPSGCSFCLSVPIIESISDWSGFSSDESINLNSRTLNDGGRENRAKSEEEGREKREQTSARQGKIVADARSGDGQVHEVPAEDRR